MVFLNCYLLKTEIVDLKGEPEGELPQYLLQVDKYSDIKTEVVSKFIYLNDRLDDVQLDDIIIKALKDEKIVKDKFDYLIDINNNSLVIECNKGVYNIVK